MVSVIIPTYARPEKVVSAISSVRKQTYSSMEIIVVDDNGIGTENQIVTQNAVCSISDKRIRYIAHQNNEGGCAARNTGVINATGEYVAFLDDDDEWADCFIDVMIRFFDNQMVGAVYCDFYSYDGFYSTAPKKRHGFEGNVYQYILEGWCPASTSLFIVKRADIVAAGLFDNTLKSFQDYDMWLRLSKICNFAHCSQRLVLKYEGFGEQTSRNPIRRNSGYQQVVQKYLELLSEEDYHLFQSFIKKYYFDTLYRTIIYNHHHGINYKNEEREYFKEYNTIRSHLHLYAILYLPQKLYVNIGRIRNRYSTDYYRGKYPI